MTEIKKAFEKALTKTQDELKKELLSIAIDSWEKEYCNPERNTIDEWMGVNKANKKKTKLKND
jgi:GTPase SAR1 family protein